MGAGINVLGISSEACPYRVQTASSLTALLVPIGTRVCRDNYAAVSPAFISHGRAESVWRYGLFVYAAFLDLVIHRLPGRGNSIRQSFKKISTLQI